MYIIIFYMMMMVDLCPKACTGFYTTRWWDSFIHSFWRRTCI